jgi:hypothetical protein
MEAAIPLAIKAAAQPNDPNKPIPCEPMIAKDKLTAECGLSETKMILGWLFNFQTLTIFLPDHKLISWSTAIEDMISSKRTNSQDLESTIGRVRHVGFIIPWVHHFSEPPLLAPPPLTELSLHKNQQNSFEGFGADEKDINTSK